MSERASVFDKAGTLGHDLSGIRLVVGLGNVGAEYERTRHNAGFWFADRLAQTFSGRFAEESKFFGSMARVRIAGNDVRILKPSTLMNRSGLAVVASALYFKILPEEILVVHDELDLMPGVMRLKIGGGNAGHNGLKDITDKLSTPNFWRLRLGTGHPRDFGLAQAVADFVLSKPNAEDEAKIFDCIEAALKIMPDIAVGDMKRAQRMLAPLS